MNPGYKGSDHSGGGGDLLRKYEPSSVVDKDHGDDRVPESVDLPGGGGEVTLQLQLSLPQPTIIFCCYMVLGERLNSDQFH